MATFLSTFLKNKKRNVKVNNTCSIFEILLSDVLQGSILRPTIFNIFPNNLFLWLAKSGIHNFADDNTISVTCRGLEKLLRILENQSNSAINWFTSNNMIVKPNKFQSICLKQKRKCYVIHS